MSWQRSSIQQRDPQKAWAAKMREEGWSDGYAGRAARYVDASYQQAWKRGREAAQAQGDLP